MKYIEFDNSKEFDLILLGRVAVDLNPVDYYCPLNESTTFKRYLGGSPANIAVGLVDQNNKLICKKYLLVFSCCTCFIYTYFFYYLKFLLLT